MPAALALTLALGAGAALAASTDPPFAPHAPSDASWRYDRVEPEAPRPLYLVPTRIDTRLNPVVTRITGDSGVAVVHIPGSHWGSDGRHQYSVRAAWSAHDSLIYIENADCNTCAAMHNSLRCDQSPGSEKADCGPLTSPSKILLDGSTYIPIAPSPRLAEVFDDVHHVLKEVAWHPQIAPYMIMAMDSASTRSRRALLKRSEGMTNASPVSRLF